MKRILISAYACEPGLGSEPGVGWNWALELAKKNKVIVITRTNNKENIEKELRNKSIDNLDFFYCDVPKLISFWKKGQRGLHLYYVLWQYYCYKLAKSIISKNKIDYCISLTFGNMWMPTFLYKLPIDFIWGPIGGGEGVPKVMWDSVSNKQRLVEIIRCLNKAIPITNPWFNRICRNSKLIIVRTTDSLECIPKKWRNRCITMIETGISEADISFFAAINDKLDTYSEDFVVSGRMISYKLIPLAIQAFSKIASEYENVKLHVLGDGPDRERIIKLIEKNNLNNRVVLHGALEREEALKIVASSKALILPSAREGGSWVMFEAMLLKKPIICFKTSGMKVVVNEQSGILINPTQIDNAIDQFAEAIKFLLINKKKCKEMGEEGYKRVIESFTWENKVNLLLEKLN